MKTIIKTAIATAIISSSAAAYSNSLVTIVRRPKARSAASLVNSMSLGDLARLINQPIPENYTEEEIANARNDEELLDMLETNDRLNSRRQTEIDVATRRKAEVTRRLEARGIFSPERKREIARVEKLEREIAEIEAETARIEELIRLEKASQNAKTSNRIGKFVGRLFGRR
jgi:hypothetical protein